MAALVWTQSFPAYNKVRELTAVIECFRCSVAEIVQLYDLLKTCDFTSLLHLILKCSFYELFF
jgi:hypothetical protein